MKMTAAVAHSARQALTLETVELADPAPGEVCVRVQACGICRSDLSALDGKESLRFPAVLGHEAAGVVEACGPGVDAPRAGDQVILSWTPACGACARCRQGEVHLCERISMTTEGRGPLSWRGAGLDRFMGLAAFAEYVVVPAAMAVPVAGTTPVEESCLVGCGVATGFGAAVNTAGVRWGESVAVLGCGGIGLAAIQGARLAGARAIFAVDPIADRRDLARRLGATHALEPDDAVKHVLRTTGGGVDVALECVGETATMRECFLMTRAGGRSVVVGLPGLRETLELPAIALLRGKSIAGSMYGSMRPSVDFQRIIDLAADGRLELAALAERARPFEEINDGLAEMRRGAATRVVLTMP